MQGETRGSRELNPSLGLEIACSAKPRVEVRTELAQSTLLAGGFSSTSWFVRPYLASAIDIDEPISILTRDLPALLAEAVPKAAWLLRIRVANNDTDAARLARAVARHAAQTFDGAVYDASSQRLLWPRRSAVVSVEISHEHRFPTVDELAIWLRETSGKTAERRLAATEHLVRERRADTLPWLRDLLRDRRRNVRHWAVDVGSQVYEREFVPHLLARLGDGSLEVRNHVLVHLRMLDPEALRPQLPRLRRWLHRPVDHPVDYKPILMTLAELRDRESIQDIELFIREMGIARNWPYYARLGRVVIEYVRGGRPAILDLVENCHDHVLTLVTCDLIKAVAADCEMAELLERASTTDQDEQWRAEFAEAASAIRTGSTQ